MADQNQVVMLEAVPDYQYTAAEVEDYARFLEIDLEYERDLFYIAEEGLQLEIPEPWQPCEEEGSDQVFYYNHDTGASVWEHPNDALVKQQVEEARQNRTTMPITLAAQASDKGECTIVGTNMAGATVVQIVVHEPSTEHLQTLVDQVVASVDLAEGVVPLFALTDGTLLGHSDLSRLIEDVLPVA